MEVPSQCVPGVATRVVAKIYRHIFFSTRRRLPEPSGRLFKELAVVTAPRLRALEELDDRFQVGEGRHGVATLVPHHLVRVEVGFRVEGSGWGLGSGWVGLGCHITCFGLGFGLGLGLGLGVGFGFGLAQGWVRVPHRLA